MLEKYLQSPKPRLCPPSQSLSSESCYAVQAVLELAAVIQSRSLKWDYRCTPPDLVLV